MRKWAFFSMVVALCALDFGAFAATVQRNTSALVGTASTASARTVARNAGIVEEEPVPEPIQSGVAARAATRQTTRPTAARVAATRPTTVKATTVTQSVSAQRPTAARAATTKQKAINMGTKISGATENTVVSEECQDAYYGCMDAFCMLDNTSGGRCQCSDRHVELDAVLEDIMKLDEQSLAMATEGVERLQMGENAEEIMARAKAAADSVTGKNDTSKTGGASKVRTLDLSSFRNNNFFDDADDDVFQDIFTSMESSIADKTGDALQKEVTRICTERIPQQCASSASFLQLTYAQRIKSDCTAYENSLKQQRSQSAEKLQTAQKALRDAALEMYQNENKYDFGQCVTQFKSCMQTTGECGDDYSGCVADTAILDELYGKGSGKSKNVATTMIKTGKTSITISSASFDILSTKKIMCESVTKQCVNANKRDSVWQQVLRDVAPIIYTAEYNAASNNRMNCISTIVNCVQTTCGSKWDEETDNYDACLSDPNSIESYCALEYKRCGDTDSENNVRNYVMAKLSALKVDKCTKDVKACLLSEDRCGEDFAGCVGLDSDTIADLCPDDLLLSCQGKSSANGGIKSVRDYVAEIAQGIALNIDNKMATTCQNAVDAAFARVCGASLNNPDAEEAVCPNVSFDIDGITSIVKPQFCYNNDCYDNLEALVDTLVIFKQDNITEANAKAIFTERLNVLKNIKIEMKGLDELSLITFNKAPSEGSTYFSSTKTETPLQSIINAMNQKYVLVINQIESDTTVDRCMNGRVVRGFKEGNIIGHETKEGRFQNLTDSAKLAISGQIQNALFSVYEKELKDTETINKMSEQIDAQYTKIFEDYAAVESELDAANEALCKNYTSGADFSQRGAHEDTYKITFEYNKETNVCKLYKQDWHCERWKNNKRFYGCSMASWGGSNCGPGAWCTYNDKPYLYKTIQMKTLEPVSNSGPQNPMPDQY